MLRLDNLLKFSMIFNIVLTEVNNVVNVTSNCKCVPYYQCTDDLDDLVTDGNGLFDVRGYKSGDCKGYFDVCCNITLSHDLSDDPVENLNGCGYQYSGTFPWSGALLQQDDSSSPHQYKCGLSLIHPYVVVTAAHCINTEPCILTAHFGNTLSIVKQTIIHPEYKATSLQNDIALLVLKTPIEMTKSANTICVPPVGIVLENATCLVTAWNKRHFIKNPNAFLKVNVVSIVTRQRCIDALRETRLGPYFHLHKSFICAGNGKTTTTNDELCLGDGGSPLICEIPAQPNRYHQVGIVSWGIGCGDNRTPGVYVNLPMFRKWIDDEMTKLKYEINIYRY